MATGYCSTASPGRSTTSTSRRATGSRRYLHDYPHAVILVSHDRYFLDAVVTRIAEVYLRTLNDYPGNYSHYLDESQARLERVREAKRQQVEELARMKQFIDWFRYQATKAAQVQSRVKMLESIGDT